MTKTADYIKFEAGFLKEAADAGCDVDFLKGYIDQADGIVEIWKNAFDELDLKHNDPLYKIKMANELVYASMVLPGLRKQANFDAGNLVNSISGGWQDFTKGLNSSTLGGAQGKLEGWANQQSGGQEGIMKWLSTTLHENPNLLSSLVAGGGGGGLLGLLMGALTGHPMMGMMLGGLGGAGAGAFLNNQNAVDKFKNMTGMNPAASQPKAPAINQAPGSPSTVKQNMPPVIAQEPEAKITPLVGQAPKVIPPNPVPGVPSQH